MTSESESDDNSDPPVRQIFVKGDAGLFSFDGYHLDFQDYRYARNVAQYLPLPGALGTISSTTTSGQPRHNDKPHGWWQSQCVFRGLSSDGTTEELQDILKGHEDDPIAEDILDLQDRARKKFKAMNKEARESNWLHHMSDEEKATKDPRRYLKETFPAGSKSKETVLLTTHFVNNIQETARELGLRCEYTHAPTDGEAVLHMAKYWVVVGQDRSIVTEKVRMIERETQRLKREQEEGQQELRRKNRVIKATSYTGNNEEAIAMNKDWDVAGLWSISCPHIEQGWDVESLTMSLYLEKTEKGPQMFAYFDFGVLTGVFRFERLKGDTKTSSARPMYSHVEDADSEEDYQEEDAVEQAERNRHDETSDDSSDTYVEKQDDDDSDESKRSPTPERFCFDTITEPSAKHSTWNYRYRGEETGLGEIQFGSDADLYSITFCGPKGQTLKGAIGSSIFGDCTFTGVRIGGDGNEHMDIQEEWANRNPLAHDDSGIGDWD